MPKPYVILIIAVAALLALGGVAAYLGLQNREVDQGMRQEQQSVATLPEPTFSEIDTSDWKTYRNDEYGVQVMYPNRFHPIKESPFATIGMIADIPMLELTSSGITVEAIRGKDWEAAKIPSVQKARDILNTIYTTRSVGGVADNIGQVLFINAPVSIYHPHYFENDRGTLRGLTAFLWSSGQSSKADVMLYGAVQDEQNNIARIYLDLDNERLRKLTERYDDKCIECWAREVEGYIERQGQVDFRKELSELAVILHSIRFTAP